MRPKRTSLAKARVLIVDDHAVAREGLRTILMTDPGLTVIGEASDGADACGQSAALRPDVVIMDLSMPGPNGLEATRRLGTVSPASRVIALTAHEEPVYVRRLLDAGARGYVLKSATSQDLLRAIHVVMDGGVFLDANLARRSTTTVNVDVAWLSADLSTREIEVASLAARGHSNAEIAATLRISVKTVETHKARLMAKLGLRSRAQLVRYALYRGWLRE